MSILFLVTNTATTHIYTLSLHDALPISPRCGIFLQPGSEHGKACSHRRLSHVINFPNCHGAHRYTFALTTDRKSTRLNSSHVAISYAVFCLKKKKKE